MKITKINVGNEVWYPNNRDEERRDMINALAHANRIVEIDGQPAEICIEINKDDKVFRARIPVERLSELEEVFNRGTIPREFREILDNIKANERHEEEPRLPGMSWVHMGIKEESELMGWVTACLVPTPGMESVCSVSFSFCRAEDAFSKRIGRIMSRRRFDELDSVSLVIGDDRYSAVKSYLLAIAAGRKPTNQVGRKIISTWPFWLNPERVRRNDIPHDVIEFIEEVKKQRIDAVTRLRAESILNKDRTPKYEVWPIRE